MFDHLVESSHQGDSNKWSTIGFGEEITQVESIEFHFKHLIWSFGNGIKMERTTEEGKCLFQI